MSEIAMMECEKYSATIPERTCFLRFGEVKYYTGKGAHQFSGCENCKIGAEVYEKCLENGTGKKEPKKKTTRGKRCEVCKKVMGSSMFGDGGKSGICIECEEDGQQILKEGEPEVVEKFKTCSMCGENLPLSDFYKNKGKKDGFSLWCKECTKFMNSQYQNTIKIPKKNDSIITIDFSLHKDLLERLRKKAEVEFRTVEQQVLFDCNALTK